MKRAMLLIAGLVAAAMVAGACDDEDTQQRANEQFCDDAAELVASLRVLRDLDRNSSIEEIEEARDRAQNAYDDMIESSADVVDVRLDELDDAYTELRRAVDAIDEDSSIPEALESVDEELEAVAQEAAQVSNDVDCGGSGSDSQSDE